MKLPKNPLEGLFCSASKQFVICVQFEDSDHPVLIQAEQTKFRKAVKALRAKVKEIREEGADVTLERMPEVFAYRVAPREGKAFIIFSAPVELLGIEPAPVEKEVRPSAEERAAAKAARAAEREVVKAQKALERKALKAEKAAEKAAKKAAQAVAEVDNEVIDVAFAESEA